MTWALPPRSPPLSVSPSHDMIACLWLRRLCSITLVRIWGGLPLGGRVPCIASGCVVRRMLSPRRCLTPVPFVRRARAARPAAPLPSRRRQMCLRVALRRGPALGVRRQERPPPQVWGCPGDSRHDGGMSLPGMGHTGWWQGQARPAPCCRGVVCGRFIPS